MCRLSGSFSSSPRLDSPTQMRYKNNTTFLLLVLATKLQVAIASPNEKLTTPNFFVARLPVSATYLLKSMREGVCRFSSPLALPHEYDALSRSTIFGVRNCLAMRISTKHSLLLFSAARLQSFLFFVGCWYDAVDRLARCFGCQMKKKKKKTRGESKEQEEKICGICYRLIPFNSLRCRV